MTAKHCAGKTNILFTGLLIHAENISINRTRLPKINFYSWFFKQVKYLSVGGDYFIWFQYDSSTIQVSYFKVKFTLCSSFLSWLEISIWIVYPHFWKIPETREIHREQEDLSYSISKTFFSRKISLKGWIKLKSLVSFLQFRSLFAEIYFYALKNIFAEAPKKQLQ